ncbi:siderophore ABC transporter substrate-binding protein [Mesobacillus subterraneus]|uniref:Siderophore ABC transporter substrate-binding protein n=1 Tax=Mesobacillus subterraneus TaxID=285983 RepID=A0A427TQZ0_9BACI|nr:siderophore ABC transporter substrate-binding protein [Mesobacillus subterraneus]RSD26788.1 siderophore ABC transporter substrate-binding protein [Mesobacillus subterraneus]
MKKLSLLILMFTMLIMLAACGSEERAGTTSAEGKSETEEMTIKHEYGEATVKKNPEKVVVFDFGVLDTLDELGVEVAGLPQVTVPQYLKKYAGKEYTNVGSLKEPDFEAIHAMKPDVIFISGRQAELYDQFAEIAPTVFITMDYANYMESFEKNMKLIGEIFEKEELVADKLKEVHASIEEISAETSASEKKALLVLANEGKVSAYGAGSRYGFIHDVFGFKAADENIEVSQHGQSITFEYILEKNPDILFVIDRTAAIGGDAGAKETVENELVKKTNAHKDGKIIYLAGDNWYLSGGGLQSMKVMIEELKAAL